MEVIAAANISSWQLAKGRRRCALRMAYMLWQLLPDHQTLGRGCNCQPLVPVKKRRAPAHFLTLAVRKNKRKRISMHSHISMSYMTILVERFFIGLFHLPDS